MSKHIFKGIKITAFALACLIASNVLAQNTNPNCLSGNCEDGYGVYRIDNGDRYIGFFENGNFNGSGSYIFSDGNMYVGNFKDDAPNGQGTYIWTDGSRYVGHWQGWKRHGIGTESDAEGNSETSIYQNDKIVDDDIQGCINGDCISGYGVFIYNDGSYYEGNFIQRKPSGQGLLVKNDGSAYYGEFKNGKYNGYGILVNPDGSEQEGIWEEGRYLGEVTNQYGCISGDCTNGYGIFIYDDGSYYEGSFKNGKRHGQGTLYTADDEVFDGAWVDDEANGYILATYKPEDRGGLAYYNGDMKGSALDGYGALIWSDGSVYYGQLKNGARHGQGVLFDTETNTKYSGIWNNDEFVSEMDENQFDVIFGSKNGFGIKLTANGRYYGNLVNGVPSGKGMLDLYNGNYYVGDLKNGMANGQGTLEDRDSGERYIGSFVNGEMTGKGVFYHADGSKEEGTFRNGELEIKKTEDVSVAKPIVTWLAPAQSDMETTSSKQTVKLCVASKASIDEVTVTVNGVVKAKKSNRGFTVVSSQCDYTFEYEIDLEPGQNEIKAIVKNAGGTTTTDARRVTLNKSDNVSSEKRLALIIGNGAYQYIGALNNPSNDARLMGETLGSLGFETMVYTDLSQNEMISKIREFGNKLTEEKAVGLFFYAGHGLQVNGENYLVPITANITKQQDVELECVNLKRVLGEMEYAQNDLNIIILDACRNNPFANMRAINSGGLAAVNAPRGTFIAFATSPGNVASDGSGSNGLYTEQLAQEITQPGIKIEDVFKKVRSRVYEISQQQQIPWENSSIFGDFYFKK